MQQHRNNNNQIQGTRHVVTMADKTILKHLFYGELKTEKRPQHKAKKRFKDNLNANQNALWYRFATLGRAEL